MYNTAKCIEIYKMTKEQSELAEKAFENLNTEIGYKALFDLIVLTKDNNLCSDILADLPMDFSWDEKLEQKLIELAKQNNREDIFTGGENAYFPLMGANGEYLM